MVLSFNFYRRHGHSLSVFLYSSSESEFRTSHSLYVIDGKDFYVSLSRINSFYGSNSTIKHRSFSFEYRG